MNSKFFVIGTGLSLLGLSHPFLSQSWADSLSSLKAESSAPQESAYDELNDEQKLQLQKGEQVFLSEDVDGAPWPKVMIYERVDSTPEEAVAVFWDVERQPMFVDNVKEAKIVNRPNSQTAEVAYRLDIPLTKDESYTVANVISDYEQDGKKSYRVDWSMIRADSTKHIEGHVRFEPLGTGTIMAYYNFVIPSSGLAGWGWIKNKALDQVKNTARALKKQTEHEVVNDPELLEKQISEVRQALAVSRPEESN